MSGFSLRRAGERWGAGEVGAWLLCYVTRSALPPEALLVVCLLGLLVHGDHYALGMEIGMEKTMPTVFLARVPRVESVRITPMVPRHAGCTRFVERATRYALPASACACLGSQGTLLARTAVPRLTVDSRGA